MMNARLTTENSPVQTLRKTTMKDVASRVGVSIATISYVLNGKHLERVSAITRRKVLKAIDEMNYTPNATARSLVMNRSQTIGLYLPQQLETILSEAGSERLLSGIIQKAALRDYRIEIATQSNNPRAFNVDGWICLKADKPIEKLEALKLPLVYVDPAFENATSTLHPLHKIAGRTLACHIKSFARKILFLDDTSTATRAYAANLRFLGMVEGVPSTIELARHTPSSNHKSLETWANECISNIELLNTFDTWVASSEELAVRLQTLSLKKCIHVPLQPHIASFEDSGISRWLHPHLLRMDMKYAELSYRATHLLLEMIDAPNNHDALKQLHLNSSPTPVLVEGDALFKRKPKSSSQNYE